MGVDKKYALLDTDFLYKSHLARNTKNHTLTDLVIEFSDYDIVTELGKLYGASATSMYLTLLQTSCDTFHAGFFEKYYGTMSNMDDLEDIETFLEELKKCDDNVPSQNGLGEKKTYVLIQMMEIMHSNQVYIFCSDDFRARQSIASLTAPIHCISILGVFYT